MKSKEIIQLAVAMVILVIAGIVIFNFVVPKKSTSSSSDHSYEIVSPISASYDQDALSRLNDSNKAHDYYVKPDLHSGVGNPLPFTPLR